MLNYFLFFFSLVHFLKNLLYFLIFSIIRLKFFLAFLSNYINKILYFLWSASISNTSLSLLFWEICLLLNVLLLNLLSFQPFIYCWLLVNILTKLSSGFTRLYFLAIYFEVYFCVNIGLFICLNFFLCLISCFYLSHFHFEWYDTLNGF